MEPEGSSPWSQQPATSPHPQPHTFSAQHIALSNIHFTLRYSYCTSAYETPCIAECLMLDDKTLCSIIQLGQLITHEVCHPRCVCETWKLYIVKHSCVTYLYSMAKWTATCFGPYWSSSGCLKRTGLGSYYMQCGHTCGVEISTYGNFFIYKSNAIVGVCSAGVWFHSCVAACSPWQLCSTVHMHIVRS